MSSPLSLAYNEDQQAIGDAVRRFCGQVNSEALARSTQQPFPRTAWQALAQLGAFAAAAPGHEESGGAKAMCAICEALGEHAFPGPVSSTYTAIQVLPDTESQGLIAGTNIVSLRASRGQLLPHGPDADLWLAREGKTIHRAELTSELEVVETLSGERAGSATLALGEALPGSLRALTLGDISAAAYLVGAAHTLQQSTAEHAATRKQFGKTLGEFQAVTHPLADCALNTTAARLLVRNAACAFDSTGGANTTPGAEATAALLSAAHAARDTAFTCHQVFGALGVTLEGPVFHFTRRIQQLISLTLDDTNARDMLLDIGLGDS